jgi:hypothetical protein
MRHRSGSVILVILSCISLGVLGGCSTGAAINQSRTIGTIGLGCQPTPGGCIRTPVVVTATTVPSTYVCGGPVITESNHGNLRIEVYPKRVPLSEVYSLAGQMLAQVGGCITWSVVRANPNRISVYFSSAELSNVGVVLRWLQHQRSVVSRVVEVS